MRVLVSTAVAAAFVAGVLAAPSLHANHVLHEKRDMPTRHWAKRDRLHSAAKLPVRIGLTQRNIDLSDDLIYEVSNHDSPRYAEWYTDKEIDELFAPAQETVDAVREWIETSGIVHEKLGHSMNKGWIAFEATAEELEKLIKAEFYTYEHLHTGKKSVACNEYHVPAHVQQHIDYITPGIKLLAGRPTQSHKDQRRALNKRAEQKRDLGTPILGTQNVTIYNTTSQELAMCDTYVTPPCIAAMYNITKGTKAAASNQMGIFEEGDYYAPEDLTLYWATYADYIPPITYPTLKGIDGGFAPLGVATGESNLDFTLAYPIIWPQTAILFQTDDVNYALGVEGGGGFLNTFLDALDGSYCTYTAFGETGNSPIDPVYPDPLPSGYQGQLMCGTYSPTNVISISYGEQEDDLPTAYQQRQCNEFKKLGMKGVTVVIASGDSGVAARSTDDGNDDGCLGPTGKVFSPDFPASCPWVTSLGATYLPTGANVYKDQEVAVTRFPSGGGFSNIYKAPAYQSAALKTYFADHKPPYTSYSVSGTNNPTTKQTKTGIYNKAGRGYPDFGAIGDNFVFFLDGTPQTVGGTSASAPAFAAIINRINEERIAAKKKPVGFVNPTLYSNPQVLHDITVGNNSGCGTPGFYAVPGWDPVTGLGTPNYPAMLKLFMGLK